MHIVGKISERAKTRRKWVILKYFGSFRENDDMLIIGKPWLDNDTMKEVNFQKWNTMKIGGSTPKKKSQPKVNSGTIWSFPKMIQERINTKGWGSKEKDENERKRKISASHRIFSHSKPAATLLFYNLNFEKVNHQLFLIGPFSFWLTFFYGEMFATRRKSTWLNEISFTNLKIVGV